MTIIFKHLGQSQTLCGAFLGNGGIMTKMATIPKILSLEPKVL